MPPPLPLIELILVHTVVVVHHTHHIYTNCMLDQGVCGGGAVKMLKNKY